MTDGEDEPPADMKLSKEELLNKYGTASQVIRELHRQGIAPAVIKKVLNTRYQHVRNVIKHELKRGPRFPSKPRGGDHDSKG